MIVFRCDVCGKTEDKRSNTFKLSKRADLCKECLKLLDMAADLFSKPGFKEQLVSIHEKFYLKVKG